MRKLSSKLRKNENNIDISLYQIRLPKVHENILKYYRLNLFKQISLASITDSRRLLNLLEVFPTVFLFKLVMLLYLPAIDVWCWFLVQLRLTQNNREDWGQMLGWYSCRNFVTASTGFSCLYGMAQSPIYRHRFFQQHPSIQEGTLSSRHLI